MHNIFLTNLCNNHCPYCFARGKLKQSLQECTEGDFLTMADARVVADFFRDKKQISFLGGEPTLHPRFEEITAMFLDMGYQVFLFTNGLFGKPIRDFLRGRQRVFHVFNINEPSLYQKEQWRTILDNLGALRENVNSLALAIYSIGQECSHIAALAREYGVKAVKIAVAAPGDDEGSLSIPFHEKHLAAGLLAGLVTDLSRTGILAYGECEKLKPCMFDDTSRDGILASEWVGNLYVNKQCRDGGNIDIGPDLTIWRCYSFQRSMGKKLTEFQTPEEIREYSRQKYDLLFFNYYWMDRCHDCEYALDERCEGGCLLRVYRKYEAREAYFYDHYYAELLEHAGDAGVTSLSENPRQVELANLEGHAPVPAEAGQGRGELILTPFLHHFSPFDVTLFAAHGGVRVFPSRVKVYGAEVRGAPCHEGAAWRKTRCVREADFVSGPFLIYETDFRDIAWAMPEISLPGRAVLALYYSVMDENGREIFCSLSPQGFSWVSQTAVAGCISLQDLVRLRTVTL